MRIAIQRVEKASVDVNGKTLGEIGQGLLILVGVEETDSVEDIDWLSKKAVNLRIFNDENGLMNRSLIDIQGELLIISQFTLMASTVKGNRPSYIRAAKHDISLPLYEQFCIKCSELIGKKVEKGMFGADMKVKLVNDGPVTIWMDSKERNY